MVSHTIVKPRTAEPKSSAVVKNELLTAMDQCVLILVFKLLLEDQIHVEIVFVKGKALLSCFKQETLANFATLSLSVFSAILSYRL